MEKRGSAVTKYELLLRVCLRYVMSLTCEVWQAASPACAVFLLAVLTGVPLKDVPSLW